MLNLKVNDPAVIAEVGYEFTVEMPDGTQTDAKIKVRGGLSKTVMNYGRKMFAEKQARDKQKKRNRSYDENDIDLTELEASAVKAAVVRIISWSGLGVEEGKELAFNQENAEMLMKDYPFIREQVIQNSEDLSNFRFG